MKLRNFVMAIAHAEQNVIMTDAKTGRLLFSGNAEELLDYSGIDDRRVTAVSADGDTLKIQVKHLL